MKLKSISIIRLKSFCLGGAITFVIGMGLFAGPLRSPFERRARELLGTEASVKRVVKSEASNAWTSQAGSTALETHTD